MADEQNAGPPAVVMYTQALCGYCSAARKLLRGKGVDYTEIDVTMDAGRRREMINRAGQSSVPQVFIDGRHVGGYDDLAELDRSDELNVLLGIDG